MKKIHHFFSGILLCIPAFVWISSAQEKELPDGRQSGHLIYHPGSKALFLFDGYQLPQEKSRNDVWKWDGRKWHRIEAGGPALKSLSSGDLNSRTGSIYMFGGVGSQGYDEKTGDTWVFDSKSWKKAETNNIGTRDHHQMVYATHLDAFVIYGGQDENRNFDTITWLLKGNQFIALSIPGPSVRYHFGMAYDPARKKVVLYGGSMGNNKVGDDVWEFNGTRWSKIETKVNPGKRLWHSMVYDNDLNMVVMHGGRVSGDKASIVDPARDTDTWGWDGKSWKRLAINGPALILPALGYDPERKVVVLYGGGGSDNLLYSALWELKGKVWNKITDNGTWKWDELSRAFVKNN